jgi:methionine-gamma-lyase
VEWVSHLSLLDPGSRAAEIYERQCHGPGAMITFEVPGRRRRLFPVPRLLRLIRHAVSLGGTESIVSHPWYASHFSFPAEEKLALGITPGAVRFSVGVEAVEDLIADLASALDRV